MGCGVLRMSCAVLRMGYAILRVVYASLRIAREFAPMALARASNPIGLERPILPDTVDPEMRCSEPDRTSSLTHARAHLGQMHSINSYDDLTHA